MKFAAPVKAMVGSLLLSYGYRREDLPFFLEGEGKHSPIAAIPGRPTPRELMQTIGTEWGRNLVHPDLWAKNAFRRIIRIAARGGRAVVDDLRFPNELAMLSTATPDHLMIHVERPGTKPAHDHPSEGLLKPEHFDVHLVNDTTLETLRQDVRAVMERAAHDKALWGSA